VTVRGDRLALGASVNQLRSFCRWGLAAGEPLAGRSGGDGLMHHNRLSQECGQRFLATPVGEVAFPMSALH
jgi:hypothetical protein